MTCPHFSPHRYGMRCALVLDMVLPGPDRLNHPCDRCRDEWANGSPPTADALTPTLVALLADVAPAPAPFVEREECVFFGRVPLSRPRPCRGCWVHPCAHPTARPDGRTTLAICAACDHHEPI